MFPFFSDFTDVALVLLRVMVGIIFIDSGYRSLKDPDARAKSIGLSKNLTVLLGLAEGLGGVAVLVGCLTHLAAIGLVLVMLGALQKKIFVWNAGFWGKDGYGWSYELMIVSMLLVILCTNGGRFVFL
jgi:putative oxidoreductase